MYAVYILIDPLDNLVRYVGMAKDVYARFIQHINCNDSNVEKNMWVIDRRSQNLMIIMKIVDQAETREEAWQMEQHWIAYYSGLGMPLFNRKLTEAPSLSRRKQRETTVPVEAGKYRFTEKEEFAFVAAYKATGNIDKVLRSMHKGSGYKQHAREVIQAYRLRENA